MMTVKEVSRLAGVSVRTLQYYDSIGLLKPCEYTESGYRLYDDKALERLQQILLFRELEFPLKEIKRIIDSVGFDRELALKQQIELLTLKREHLDNLINHAREVLMTGDEKMDFSVFDTKKIDEYSKRAREQWGQTEAYREFEKKSKGRTKEDEIRMADEFMKLFEEFGEMKLLPAEADEVQRQVKRLQDYISEHFYTCTDEILRGLGQMYACGGEFTENIDRAGGEGTAEFTANAIENYCDSRALR